MSSLPPKEVYAKTIYAEARGECREGQQWVGWVIKNRADNGNRWPNNIKDVCLEPQQFSCWNGRDDIEIKEQGVYDEIKSWSDVLFDEPISGDISDKSDHYFNPKIVNPSWAKEMRHVRDIENHSFYSWAKQ